MAVHQCGLIGYEKIQGITNTQSQVPHSTFRSELSVTKWNAPKSGDAWRIPGAVLFRHSMYIHAAKIATQTITLNTSQKAARANAGPSLALSWADSRTITFFLLLPPAMPDQPIADFEPCPKSPARRRGVRTAPGPMHLGISVLPLFIAYLACRRKCLWPTMH
jgi:hypothetical protein